MYLQEYMYLACLYCDNVAQNFNTALPKTEAAIGGQR